MDEYMTQWNGWLDSISRRGINIAGGSHFSNEGVVIRSSDKIENSPYVHEHNSLAGFIMVEVRDLAEAIDIAKECPILNGQNTSVEIRKTDSPG